MREESDQRSAISDRPDETGARPRVVLAVIAKDMPENLLRALKSGAGLADEAVIVVAPGDPLLVVDYSDVPFPVRLYEHAWEGFARTRNVSLDRAEEHGADWILTVDSNDHFEEGGALPDLASTSATAFDLRVVQDGLEYRRQHLFRAREGWHYKGVVHEALYGKPGTHSLHWDGLVYHFTGTVRASRERFLADAALLSAELDNDPGDTRSAFYLAQSLRDAGQDVEALAAYVRRGNMTNGFGEENFWSWIEAARLMWRLGFPWESIGEAYRYAATWAPKRAEPLSELARLYRTKGDDVLADTLDAAADQIPWPRNAGLFVDPSAYARASGSEKVSQISKF